MSDSTRSMEPAGRAAADSAPIGLGAGPDGARPDCFEISPLMLFPGTTGWFSVYLMVEGKLVLYANGPEGFTEEHQHRLHDFGLEKVHILAEQKNNYQRYVEDNLGGILINEKIPLKERAEVFYTASLDLIRETFEKKLPGSIRAGHFNRITELVEESLRFIRKEGSLKAVTGLISHDYNTYNHCVNVFVLSAALLDTYEYKHKDKSRFSLGAILHDLGKSMIPLDIINKPGKLDPAERAIIETHPVKGAAMCAHLPLASETLNAILFHHERLDGTGYPAGMSQSGIPIPIRVVALVDVYDALTSDRPYAKQRTPIEALAMIRDRMGQGLDMDVFRRLVRILSGADVT